MASARPWWRVWLPWVAGFAAIFVIGGHIALWRAPDVPLDVKWRLTLLNAAGWAVVILPAIGVSYWLKAKTAPRDPD
ncbi:MAG: phenylalanyl-tRNA synthetase subunit beta [Pseudomonadota bacterium]